MADDGTPEPFMTVDLFALDGPTPGSRGVLAGVHIHYPPAGVPGPAVAYSLHALADSLAGELDGAFASILADTN